MSPSLIERATGQPIPGTEHKGNDHESNIAIYTHWLLILHPEIYEEKLLDGESELCGDWTPPKPTSPIDIARLKNGLPPLPNPTETRKFNPDDLPSFPPTDWDKTDNKE
jgi:hypothetical protein